MWRSLEPRAIYQLQKQIGAIYRQELALKVRELGYDIDVGKDSMFEIRGISVEAMAAFSTRSAEIEAALGERGTTRDEASAAEKQIAALDTRQAKVATDQASLVRDWRETADGAGFGTEVRMALVNAAEAKAAAPDHKAAMAMHGDMTADRAIAHAADKLGERQSVFSASELQEEAGRFGLGKVSYAQIAQAIESAAKQADLLPRSYVDRRGAEFAGFTIRANVETETKLLRIEAAGRGILPPIASRMDAAKAVASAAADAKRTGFDWNNDQRAATTQLLASRNRMIALQGYVETAFAAQGRTADHVIIHADSRATNLVDQKSFYVSVSRAKASVAIYTNDRAKLVSAISERAGVTQTALAQSMGPVPKAAKVIGAGLG